MKKSIRKIVEVLMALSFITSLLSGCKRHVGDALLGIKGTNAKGMTVAEDARIDSLSYSYNATYVGGMYTYTAYREGNACKLEVIYRCINEEEPEIYNIDERVMDDLMAVIRKYDMGAWDGYAKVATNVLDGSGFSIDIKFNDGTGISARGSNCGPDNYGSATKEIEQILTPFAYDFLVEKGIIYVEPTYYPLEMAVATSYKYSEEYVSRLRTCHMTKAQAEKYPETAKKLADINREACEAFSETNSAIVNIVRADTNVLSVVLYEYDPQKETSEGYGVPGTVKTYNFRTESGEEIHFSDTFRNNPEDLYRQLRNEIHGRYNSITIEELDPLVSKWYADSSDMKFVIAADWMMVYFNPGEIADESLGLLQVPYAYASKFFYDGSLFKHPASYVTQFNSAMDIYANMDHDTNQIIERMKLLLPKDQGISDFYIVYLEDGTVAFYQDASFFAAEDTPEDDIKKGDFCREMRVYSLDDVKLTELYHENTNFAVMPIDEIDAEGRESYGDGLLVRAMPLNPADFKIDTKDVSGQSCYIGQDKVPTAK